MKIIKKEILFSLRHFFQVIKYWGSRGYTRSAKITTYLGTRARKLCAVFKTRIIRLYKTIVKKPTHVVIYNCNDTELPTCLKECIDAYENIICISAEDKRAVSEALNNKLPIHYVEISQLINDKKTQFAEKNETMTFSKAYKKLSQTLLLNLLFSSNPETAQQWFLYYSEQLNNKTNLDMPVISVSLCGCPSKDESPLKQVIIDINRNIKQRLSQKSEKVKALYLALGPILATILFITSTTILITNHKLNQQANELINTVQQSDANQQYSNLNDMIDFIDKNNHKVNWLYLRINKNITEKLSRYIYHRLTSLLAKPIAQQLEKQLLENQDYTKLEEYLLLFTQLYPIDSMTQKHYADLWQDFLWKSATSMDVDLDPNKFINFYITYRKNHTLSKITLLPKKNLIAQTRKELNMQGMLQSFYQRYQQQQLTQHRNQSLAEWIGDANYALKSKAGLSYFYSYHHWQANVKNDLHQLAIHASQGNWVLNQSLSSLLASKVPYHASAKVSEGQIQTLEQQLNEIYYQQLVHAWLRLIKTLSLDNATTITEQQKILSNIVKNNDYQRLLNLIKENTLFVIKQSHNTLLVKKVKQMNSDVSEVGKKVVENYLQNITEFRQDLVKLSQSSDTKHLIQNYARSILMNRADNNALYKMSIAANLLTLDMQNEQVKKSFQHLFQLPVESSWQLLLNLSYVNLMQQWHDRILDYYQKNLKPYFPFTKSQQDAEVAHVIRFYQPSTGLLTAFIQKDLAGFMQNNANNWHVNKWHKLGLPVTNNFIKSLQNMGEISHLLFANSKHLGFTLSVMPLASPYTQMIKLSINQQTISYYNGPAYWYMLKWHDDLESSTISLDIIDANRDFYSKQFTGPWSVLRLLSNRHSFSKSNKHCKLTWLIHKTQVNMLLKRSWCHTTLIKKGFLEN